jgi:hypothetical protein
VKKYKFNARIEKGDGGGAYVYFPFDFQKEFGSKGNVPVKATFDGVPFTGSLINTGRPSICSVCSKAIRGQIGKDVADTIEVEVWKEEDRAVEIPADFEKLLKKKASCPFSIS